MTVETIPVLPSADFDETSVFYSRMGFVETARYPGEYLILRHPLGIELHFFADPRLDPASNAAGAYIRFDTAAGAQALYDGWHRSGLSWEHLRTPAETDYGLLEFAVLDCHRNLLRVGGRLDPEP